MVDQGPCMFYNKCRTCFNQTKGLQSLTNAVDGQQKISYADLLKEVTNINIKEDKNSELPQHICSCCSRKLKSSHAFIKQAKEVNDKLWTLLNKAISDGQKLDCLQECEVDIQQCLEIKMEADDVEDGSYSKNPTATECELQLKKEFLDDVSEDAEENNKNTTLEIDDTEQSSCHEAIDSDSSRKDMDFSETESEEEELPSTDIQNKREKSKTSVSLAPKEKKHRLSKDTKDEEDTDIAVPCLQCNKIFNNSKELSRHLRNTHVPEEQKCACPLCGAKFTRSCNMYKHMRTLHDPESVNVLLPAKEKTHQCDKCPRKYTKKKHLNYHIRAKHSGGEKKEDAKAIQEPATDAKRKPEVRPLCFICGGSFSNKAHLIVHMRRHTGERPFKCDLCDRAFPRISELTCHRRIHTGEKPYKCKICEKTFRVSTKLATHMRSHTDERPYKCTQCERSFKYSKDLNIHNRIHTGERPYCCTVCGSTFTQSNSLKAHRTKLGHMENNT